MLVLVHASLDFVHIIRDARTALESFGCQVLVPDLTRYQHIRDSLGQPEEFNRIKNRLAHESVENLVRCDALLVLNPDHRGIRNYVGGQSFFSMSVAFSLSKPIFLSHDPPLQMPYSEEIMALYPTVIGGIDHLTERKWQEHASAAGLC